MWYIIWRILNSTHFKVIFKCFQAIFIELQREQFLIVALLFYKKMAVLALFKTNHTGPSSTGPLGQHQISGYTGPPLCSWDEKMRCQQKEPFILGTIAYMGILLRKNQKFYKLNVRRLMRNFFIEFVKEFCRF